MGLFDRFENKTEVPACNYDRRPARADEPDSWSALGDAQHVLSAYVHSENPMRIIRTRSGSEEGLGKPDE